MAACTSWDHSRDGLGEDCRPWSWTENMLAETQAEPANSSAATVILMHFCQFVLPSGVCEFAQCYPLVMVLSSLVTGYKNSRGAVSITSLLIVSIRRFH